MPAAGNAVTTVMGYFNCGTAYLLPLMAHNETCHRLDKHLEDTGMDGLDSVIPTLVALAIAQAGITTKPSSWAGPSGSVGLYLSLLFDRGYKKTPTPTEVLKLLERTASLADDTHFAPRGFPSTPAIRCNRPSS